MLLGRFYLQFGDYFLTVRLLFINAYTFSTKEITDNRFFIWNFISAQLD